MTIQSTSFIPRSENVFHKEPVSIFQNNLSQLKTYSSKFKLINKAIQTQGQVLILDNATFHKSKTSRKLIEECGCKILFLPPYSPDLNPIEKYWAKHENKNPRTFAYCNYFIRSFRSSRFINVNLNYCI